jgi:hypothetical protein
VSSKKKTKPPVKLGRPTDYREEYCQALIDWRQRGGTYEGFAGSIGVSKQTLYDWEKAQPAFLDAKRRARQKHRVFMDQIGLGLMTGKLKGSAGVWIFVMKNEHGYRDDPIEEEDAIEGIEFFE